MSPKIAKISRTFHWITSAMGLATLVFFSVTGVTLNHPEWFEVASQRQVTNIQMSDSWRLNFTQSGQLDQFQMLTEVLDSRWSMALPATIDRDEFEWVLDYQLPGGVTTVVLDLQTGVLSKEAVSDGVVALINDLHKGRHSGAVWSLLIDTVALICVVFSITGLLLLLVHARKRPSTWPLALFGLLVPVACYLLFVPS